MPSSVGPAVPAVVMLWSRPAVGRHSRPYGVYRQSLPEAFSIEQGHLGGEVVQDDVLCGYGMFAAVDQRAPQGQRQR